MIIEGVRIKTEGFNFDNPPPDYDELKNYVEYVRELVPNVASIDVKLCDDNCVDLKYTAHNEKFYRLRRITGYLTSDLSRWNDAKQAEERDRVKHDTKI